MKHPYPEHVVEAVAEAMGRSRTGEDWGRFQDYFIEHTHVALQALWDASRITTVSEAEQLADDVRVITPRGAYMAPWSLDPEDLPAHVIDWGDHDE